LGGWCLQTSDAGELFYHNANLGTSQWQMPSELRHVFGEWIQAIDPEGRPYWWNEVSHMTSWTDPRCTVSIFQAALDGDLFFLQLYVGAGGSLSAVDASGCTSLHYACARGSEPVVQYLLQSKAPTTAGDPLGATPLHWACRYGNAAAVRLLLEADRQVDSRDAAGYTPLHVAAEEGFVEGTRRLLQARADPRIQGGEQSKTPAEVAVASGAHEVAALLMRHLAPRGWDFDQDVHEGLRGWEVDQATQPQAVRDAARIRSQASLQCFDIGGDEDAEEEPVSPVAMAVVRAARPLLRGVKWFANRMRPVDNSRLACWERGHGTVVLEAEPFQWSELKNSLARSVAGRWLAAPAGCEPEAQCEAAQDSRSRCRELGRGVPTADEASSKGWPKLVGSMAHAFSPCQA